MDDLLTINLAAIRSRRDVLTKELADLNAILAIAPRLQQLGADLIGGTAAGAADTPSRSRTILVATKHFVSAHREEVQSFAMSDVIAWLKQNEPSVNPDDDRDLITAALRTLVDRGRIHVAVSGRGLKPQIWGFGPADEPTPKTADEETDQ